MSHNQGDLAPRPKRKIVPYPEMRYDRPEELVAAIEQGAKQVFVISDTHLFHNRLWEVLRPTAEGGRDPRNTELILKSWRRLVQPDDLVLHLGDVVLGVTIPTIAKNLGFLPGHVWLLPGNHDRSVDKLTVYREELGWKLVKPFEAQWQGRHLMFTHEPVAFEELPENGANVHGHTHHHLELSPDGTVSVRHLNCCIEQLGYEPVPLAPLLDRFVASLPEALPQPQGYYVYGKNGEKHFVESKRQR